MIAVLLPGGDLAPGTEVALDDEESRHVQVRRVTDLAACVGYDGAGTVADGQLVRRGRAWAMRVDRVTSVPRPTTLVVAVGAGDKDRFLWLAEKACELTVSRIIPLETERQRNVENRVRGATLDKARRRATEACKQCGNAWAPVIDDVTPLEQIDRTTASIRWLLAAAEGKPVDDLDAGPVGWIVGPEGGLTPHEISYCRDALHATPTWLAPSVLRFETAAIAAAAITLDRRRLASLAASRLKPRLGKHSG